jgi:hypothetical protein
MLDNIIWVRPSAAIAGGCDHARRLSSKKHQTYTPCNAENENALPSQRLFRLISSNVEMSQLQTEFFGEFTEFLPHCNRLTDIRKKLLHLLAMKLKRFLLRYYPPGKSEFSMPPALEFCEGVCGLIGVSRDAGIILEYEKRDGSRDNKAIDLLHLSVECVESNSPEHNLRSCLQDWCGVARESNHSGGAFVVRES